MRPVGDDPVHTEGGQHLPAGGLVDRPDVHGHARVVQVTDDLGAGGERGVRDVVRREAQVLGEADRIRVESGAQQPERQLGCELAGEFERRDVEALHEDPAAHGLLPDVLDDPGHLGVAVAALDLQEEVAAALAQVRQLGGQGRDPGPGVGGANHEPAVQLVEPGGGEGADPARAVGRPVDGGVVQDVRHAVAAGLDVVLDPLRAAPPGDLVGDQGVLGGGGGGTPMGDHGRRRRGRRLPRGMFHRLGEEGGGRGQHENGGERRRAVSDASGAPGPRRGRSSVIHERTA